MHDLPLHVQICFYDTYLGNAGYSYSYPKGHSFSTNVKFTSAAVDRDGQTPLSLAYSNRHLETVKYLVQEQQCNPNCRLCTFCFLLVMLFRLLPIQLW